MKLMAKVAAFALAVLVAVLLADQQPGTTVPHPTPSSSARSEPQSKGNPLEFIASGNGAVTRTLIEKLRDTVSVKDFGARGDGKSDDTRAFQAALNAIAGGTLHIPQGTYLISSPLRVTSFTEIRGSGWSTILRPNPAIAVLFDLTGAEGARISSLQLSTPHRTTPYRHILLGPGAYFNTLESLYLNANTVTGGQMGIELRGDDQRGALWNVIENVLIYGFDHGIDASGIGAQGQGNTRISNSRVETATEAIVLGGPSGNGCAGCVLNAVTMGSFTRAGIHVGSATYAAVARGIYMEGHRNAAVLVVDRGARDNVFEVIHAGPTPYLVDNGTRTQIYEVNDSNLISGGGGLERVKRGFYIGGGGNNDLRMYSDNFATETFRVTPSGTVFAKPGGAVPVRVDVPATRRTPCAPGAISWDSGYFYVCYAANSWERFRKDPVW